jgi:hypothetical protein
MGMLNMAALAAHVELEAPGTGINNPLRLEAPRAGINNPFTP